MTPLAQSFFDRLTSAHQSRRRFLRGATLAVAANGCIVLAAEGAKKPAPREDVLFGAGAVLYQLLEKQKHLKKLLLIKRERDDLQKVIEEIASASKLGAVKLKELARQTPAFSLDRDPLPASELQTREAIERTRTRDLLRNSGADFELELLLSQSEALTYAWHLAEVCSANDSNGERGRYFAQLSGQMRSLRQQIFSLIRARSRPDSLSTKGSL